MKAQVADVFLQKFQLKPDEIQVLRGAKSGTMSQVSGSSDNSQMQCPCGMVLDFKSEVLVYEGCSLILVIDSISP